MALFACTLSLEVARMVGVIDVFALVRFITCENEPKSEQEDVVVRMRKKDCIQGLPYTTLSQKKTDG